MALEYKTARYRNPPDQDDLVEHTFGGWELIQIVTEEGFDSGRSTKPTIYIAYFKRYITEII